VSRRKANLLASNYALAKSEDRKEMYFKELKNIMIPFVQRMKRRFTHRTLKKIDYMSIADEALFIAASKYKVDVGYFDTYYGIWLRGMATREIINNPEFIKLPEYLAKKDYQISKEEKIDMVNGLNLNEIKKKYRITDNELNNLIHYYKESPKFFSLSENISLNNLNSETELREDIKRAFKHLPGVYLDVVTDYFGLFGKPKQSKSIVYRKHKLSVNKVIKELSSDEEFKKLLGDYNEE